MSLSRFSQEKIDQLALLPSLAKGDLQALIAETAELVAMQMDDCYQVNIWLQTDDNLGFYSAGLYRVMKGHLTIDAYLDRAAYPAYIQALQRYRLIDASHARDDTRSYELQELYLQPQGILSLFSTAIRFEGELVGILSCEYRDVTNWNEDDRQFVTQVADQLSLGYSHFRHKQLIDGQQNFIDSQLRLFSAAPDALFMLTDGKVVDCNPAAVSLFAATSAQQLIGLSPDQFSPRIQASGENSAQLVAKLLANEDSDVKSFKRFEWQHRKFNGEIFDAEVTLSAVASSQDGMEIAVVRDISAQKKQQIKLHQLAYSCVLTGLANRQALMDFCQQVLERDAHPLCLLSVDINNFKSINQSLGGAIGDGVLKIVAERLHDFFIEHSGHCVARVAGNEFIVALSKDSNKMKLRLQAESLRQRLEQPVLLEDMALSIAVTIAICDSSEDGHTIDALWGALSTTMENARRDFIAIQVCSHNRSGANDLRRLLITQLETAIEEDQLSLFYQPKLSLHSNRCIGFEALLRWNHPDRGLIPPDQFIPLVEKDRLITPLTNWVIKSACVDLQQWLKINPDITIAINLSTRNLLDQNLPGFIRQQLEMHGIAAKHLQLEVTESSMMADPERSLQTIHQLHALGTPLVIDDYGTGHSSLAYLRELPVQELKIDRAFITEALIHEHDRIIVESIIHLAHKLGLTVVAEGVEDSQTQQYLQDINCDVMQGFYFSKPLPSHLAKAFLTY